ncbi:hypothetical protein DB35_11370 [Streptomyces abyssalis]|uniref:Lipoprotein n=2 Tax=Streptomyces abyssalis TaxID=933944 RepID=A0A1E7JIV5_9ACTN|nr:hypothetical protein AN215_26550 [Streptomyces abyssalis]OEU93241.1 hypothetical protein DB35_11370 [Streptomyces abyssalis]
MPPPDPPAWGCPQPPAGPRRRSMVAGTLGTLAPLGALTTLTSGCSGDDASADAEQVAASDKRLRREAARQSLELLASYDATADAHSGLADRLRPLRESTMRHAEVLSGEGGGENKGGDRHGSEDDDGSRNDGGAGGDRWGHPQARGSGGGKHGRPRVPDGEKAALTALGDAERRTARARTAAMVKAPPETARVLASLAAAGAAHAYLLGAQDGRETQDRKDGGA